MIEGQFNGIRVENIDLGGVRGSLHLTAQDLGQEGDADVVAARVAVRVGVDADEARDLHGEARLLRGLAHGGLLHGLPHLNEAPWQRPLPLERFAAAADEDHPLIRGDHHVHHQLRRLWSCQGRTSRVFANCPRANMFALRVLSLQTENVPLAQSPLRVLARPVYDGAHGQPAVILFGDVTEAKAVAALVGQDALQVPRACARAGSGFRGPLEVSAVDLDVGAPDLVVSGGIELKVGTRQGERFGKVAEGDHALAVALQAGTVLDVGDFARVAIVDQSRRYLVSEVAGIPRVDDVGTSPAHRPRSLSAPEFVRRGGYVEAGMDP